MHRIYVNEKISTTNPANGEQRFKSIVNEIQNMLKKEQLNWINTVRILSMFDVANLPNSELVMYGLLN